MTMEYEPGWYMDSDTGKFVHPNVTNVSEGKPVFGEDNVIEGKLLRYINDGHYFEQILGVQTRNIINKIKYHGLQRLI